MRGLNSVNWSQLLSPETDIPHDVSFKILTKDVSKNMNGAGCDKNGRKYDLTDGSVEKKEQHDLIQLDEALKIYITNKFGMTGGDSWVKDSSQSSVHSPKIKSIDNPKTNKSTPKLDSQTILPVHKLLLASVSPVFRRQFYGSIPAGEVVIIEDSTVKAFKMMIDYIYQNTADDCVENLADVHELLATYYLAEKYEVLGWKEKIVTRLSLMPVNLSNYEILVSCLLKYSYFEDACQVLERRVLHFIKLHWIPLELVQGAIDSQNDDIKHEVLTKLVIVGEKSILETVKAGHDILKSEGCKLHETKSLRLVMISCVQSFEDLKQDPLKFSQFFPDPDSDLQEAVSLLFQYLKNNFCKNCESSVCKQGKHVDISKVKVGVRFVVDGFKTGTVSQVGLVKVKKLSSRLVNCNGPPCPSFCTCRKKVYTYCPVCRSQGMSMVTSISCNGLHSESVSNNTASRHARIQLVLGEEVISTDDRCQYRCV